MQQPPNDHANNPPPPPVRVGTVPVAAGVHVIGAGTLGAVELGRMASDRRRRRPSTRRDRSRRRRLRVGPRSTSRPLAQPPEFADSDGPLLYRHALIGARARRGRRRWITLDGIFYQADVWLDGAYLGDPEGYFIPHTFDISALSRIGDEHVVAIEVACPPQPSPRNKRTITGVFQHWDGIDRDWNPGGIWQPVRMYDTGPVRIDRFRVLCRDADETRAQCCCRRNSTATARARSRCARWSTASVAFEQRTPTRDRTQPGQLEPRHRRPSGCGGHVRSATSRSPRSRIEVLVDGEVSDRQQRRTGLRVVAWNNWSCSVNGERLFLKGANLLPTRAALAEPHPRRPAGHRTRRRRRARRAARARAHRHPPHLRGRRRARHAGAPGLPAQLGIRPIRSAPSRRPGSSRRRPARASSVDRAVERPQRTDRGGGRDRGRHARGGYGTSPATSSRRGTRRCSTAG